MAAEASDVSNNKVIAILSYFIFFIPLLSTKRSPFAMFHANQGLIILILSIASSLLSSFIPVVGGIAGTIISVGVLILMIMGIISAANGETKPLPVVGQYKLLK
jgi:uncharacterized membrane protein